MSEDDDQAVGILIIGSGPTGLGAACRLHELGFSDYFMCERELKSGGLATTDVCVC